MARKLPNPSVAITSTQSAVRVPRKRMLAMVAHLSRQQDVRFASVDIAVVADAEMAELNVRYLNHAGPTDVLSFDMSDEHTEGLVAQIIVCGDVAAREAGQHDHCAARELLLYVTHGLLHLTGYDDKTPSQASAMQARADELLGEVYPQPRRS